MENFPGFGPDFSSLAESSKKTPEKDDDDDDNDKVEKKDKKPSIFEWAKQPDKPETDKSNKKAELAKQPPLETLADDEKQQVAQEIVKARKEEVRDELKVAPQDTLAEQEALVAATFLEVLDEEVKGGEAIEAALAISEAKALDIAGVEADDAEEVPNETMELPKSSIETDAPTTPEDEEDSPIVPHPVAAAGGGTTLPVVPTAPYGGGRVPPVGPTGPGFTAPGFSGTGGPGAPGAAAGNTLPTTPNIAPNQVQDIRAERQAARRGLLVGGIVGYLIGRRRGRIKTEKKLLPVQRKLEKEVTDLQWQITEREEKIRSIVSNQSEKKPETQQQTVQRMQALQELKHVDRERKTEKQVGPQWTEQLGKFALGRQQPSSERVKASERPENVELMTETELLNIADKITVEGSTVKRLFETNRLNDEGLRRAIRAYLRGERFDRVIAENLKMVEQYKLPEALRSGNAAGGSSGSTDQTAGMFMPPSPVQAEQEPAALPTPESDSAFTVPSSSTEAKKRGIQAGLVVLVVILAVALTIFVVNR